MSSHHKHMGGPANDDKFFSAIHELERAITLDRAYDIPYLAGYSVDGKTIYIDRSMPRGFYYRGRFILTDKFLIIHETSEKAKMMLYKLHYIHAHQFALYSEEHAVQTEIGPQGLRAYNAFMDAHIKTIDHEDIRRVPANLDLTPYIQEHARIMVEQLKSKMVTA